MSILLTTRVFQDQTIIEIKNDTNLDYIVSGSRMVRDRKIEWRIYPITNHSKVKYHDAIEHLLTIDDDALFQESCIREYDPYFVKAAMLYIIEEFKCNRFINPYTVSIELEY